MNEKILNFAKISTLAVLLAFGITQVSSWTAPTAVPPDGNVSAPINVGNATQTKAGNLTVGSLTSNGDIDVTGDNLMNVATPIAPADGVNKAYVDAQSTINGGGGGGGYADLVWGYTDKHYFVTQIQHKGNLGGFAGADAMCNTDPYAISGKTYTALFQHSQGSHNFNKPGVGLYNNIHGWVNSKLRISDPTTTYISTANTTQTQYLVISNNPTGMGIINRFITMSGINNTMPYIISPDDLNLPYIVHSSDFWWDNDGCRVLSSNWVSDSSGDVSDTARLSTNVGVINNTGTVNCNVPKSILCIEN